MTDQEREQLNRFLHEFMGRCWQEFRVDLCTECGLTEDEHPVGGNKFMAPSANPDYCSEDSPRSLLREVEEKVIAETDLQKYLLALVGVLKTDGTFTEAEYDNITGHLMMATNEQRCQALKNAIEQARKGI